MQPTAAEPVAAEPVAAEPVAAEPVAAGPIVVEPTALEDSLSQQSTVQKCASTQSAITELRNWATEGPIDTSGSAHCVISAPLGCGRTHLLDALAGVLAPENVIRCSPNDPDWRPAIELIANTNARRVLIDDLDRFDDKFHKAVLPSIAKNQHRIVATVRTPFVGRLTKHWSTHLRDPRHIQLDGLAERAADIIAFLPHWAQQNGVYFPESAEFMETADVLLTMELPGGLNDIVRMLKEISSRQEQFWDPPKAKTWFSAYRQTTRGGAVDRPVILVEGRTDAVYFQWVLQLAGGDTSGDLDIEPCNSATKIPAKAFQYRNEGRKAVALFDNDKIGQDQHRQMRDYGILSVIIPQRYDQLKDVSQDHVQVVIEIEDLLPVEDVERFLQIDDRMPELIITAPRQGKKRIVVHPDDKMSLAEWTRANLGARSAQPIAELFNELRKMLGLSAVNVRQTTLS